MDELRGGPKSSVRQTRKPEGPGYRRRGPQGGGARGGGGAEGVKAGEHGRRNANVAPPTHARGRRTTAAADETPQRIRVRTAKWSSGVVSGAAGHGAHTSIRKRRNEKPSCISRSCGNDETEAGQKNGAMMGGGV